MKGNEIMAIRSLIAIQHADKTVESIYCHWGGEPKNNGRCLFEHYSDRDKIEYLISFGSLARLESRIDPVAEHSWESPESGTCVFYHRDRNDPFDDGVKSRTHDDITALLDGNLFWIEYIYIFTAENIWTMYVRKHGEVQKRQILQDVLD